MERLAGAILDTPCSTWNAFPTSASHLVRLAIFADPLAPGPGPGLFSWLQIEPIRAEDGVQMDVASYLLRVLGNLRSATPRIRRLAMKKPKIDHQSDDSVIAGAFVAAQGSIDRLKQEWEHDSRLATLGTLAAGIVHEINNILTPVLAFAQMARAKPDDHALQTKALEKTVQGVELATRIANAILGFASTSDDRETDVAQVVQAALDCLGRNPNKDRINMCIEVQAGTIVRMGFLSLQQVLLNLFLNAIAAMDGRGGRLKVAALTRADGTVGIRVGDTGPGIAKEVAGRIFEPFVTTKRSNEAGPASGSGLGLAICRRLIEEAGGTITATSKPGNGTTFHIILPSGEARRAKAS